MQNWRGVEFDFFDLLQLIRYAYENSFIPTNISKAFEKCGLFPVNAKKLLSVCRPRDANNPDNMCDADMLKDMVEAKRGWLRRGECLQPVVLRRGVVQNSHRFLVTRTETLDLMAAEAERVRQKQEEKEKKEKNDIEAFNRIRVQKRNEPARFDGRQCAARSCTER